MKVNMTKATTAKGFFSLAAVFAGCAAGAHAGEFQSALVGKVRYDDVPGWTD